MSFSDTGAPAGPATPADPSTCPSTDPSTDPSPTPASPSTNTVSHRSSLTEFFEAPPLPTLPQPETQKNLGKSIFIYHPAYPKSRALAVFAACDEGGVHYNVVYYACCIISCNVWSDDEGRNRSSDTPFLSETPDPNPITVPDDNILLSPHYWFHVPNYNTENPYPVTPNFYHWKFPPSIPKPWRDLKIPDFADLGSPEVSRLTHNESCRVTRSLIAVEQSHIIPQAAKGWFYDNQMANYITSPNNGKELDDFSNIIPFRADVHRLFDASNICIFPKPHPVTKGEIVLVMCVLRPAHKSSYGDYELFARYHNRKLLELKGALPEYLFARFAWAIFNDETYRLFGDKDRMIHVQLLQQVKNEGNQWTRKMIPSSKIPKLRSGGSTRTSKKRAYEDMYDDIEEQYLSDSDDYSNGPKSPSMSPPFDYIPYNSRPSKRSRYSSESNTSSEQAGSASQNAAESVEERFKRIKQKFSTHASTSDPEQLSQLPALSSSLISTGSSGDSALSGVVPYTSGALLPGLAPEQNKAKNSHDLPKGAF
ncbi:hypothetical protein F4859DRAFT_466901 [Xylaria cf. heliscus]|nr:hypothetical protein F4859DRAFT_466901 [Xylaria cf. heliscus]